MKIFVVTLDWDGQNIVEFDEKRCAEEFCTKFLKDKTDYGGQFRVFQGRELHARVVQRVDAIELIDG